MKTRTARLTAIFLGIVPLQWTLRAGDPGWSGTLTAAPLQAQSAAVAPPQDSITLTRVWAGANPSFYASSPSPDGRYLTDIDWTTGNLALLDLRTGTHRDVTRGGSWVDSLAWAESSAFSPDGSRIAYAWFSPGKSGYEIWMINTDGANPHVLLPKREGRAYFLVEDWSPDGRYLLVQSVGASGIDLALVSTEDRSLRALTSLGYDYTPHAAFSPDSRYVAYTHPSGEGAKDSDILAVSVADGRSTRLLGGPSDDQFMGWTPDGRSILFYSDREVTQGIWSAPVGPGLRVGQPELLRADVWRLVPLGFSRDAYFYGVSVEEAQVNTGAVDLEAGRFLRSPTPVQDAADGGSTAGDWSPDGQYLAYAVNDPAVQSWHLVIRPVAGDGAREIPLALKSVGRVRWGPDSRSVMIVGILPQLRDAIVRVDLAQGRMETVLCFSPANSAMANQDVSDVCPPLTAHGDWHNAEFSPDGRTLYFARRDFVQGEGQVVAKNLASGAERVVVPVRDLLNLSVSPDGRTLALADQDRSSHVNRIITVPASGGEAAVLHTFTDGAYVVELQAGLPWAPDARHILFVTEDGVLWKIPSGGGEPQRVVQLPGSWDYRHFRLHPDGSRIAYTTGDSKGEIWKIESFPGGGRSNGGR